MRDKHRDIEEPDEVKISRPVLKTSRVGNNLAEFNQTSILLTVTSRHKLDGQNKHCQIARVKRSPALNHDT